MLFGSQLDTAGCRCAQRRAKDIELLEPRRAVRTRFQMRVDFNLLTDRQFVVVIRLQAPTGRGTAQQLHRVLASRSSRRKVCRARVSRDFTVPTATPSEYAISS
jgi:hypothetical protein